MKTAKKLLTAAAIWAATVSAAAAATGARDDHSGILVWAFLGLCALIVAAQIVPAVLMTLGLVRGVLRPSTLEGARK
jgi:hypothetical protein